MISVVMTTYNGAAYVEQQMNSILEQTLAPDEVLIFDDCSTDGETIEIVKKYIKKINNRTWKLFENKLNKGWKKNFIEGIKKAKGNYIFLSDQDDLWDRTKIEKMYSAIEKNSKIDLLCCNYCLLNETGKKVKSNSTQRMLNDGRIQRIDITEKFHLVGRPGCTFCIRSSFAMKACDLWMKGYAHDKLFWNYAVLQGRLYCINEPLVIFRRHDHNASSRGPVLDARLRADKQILDMIIFTKMINEIPKENLSNELICSRYNDWVNLRIKALREKKIILWISEFRFIMFYSSFSSYMADLVAIIKTTLCVSTEERP